MPSRFTRAFAVALGASTAFVAACNLLLDNEARTLAGPGGGGGQEAGPGGGDGDVADADDANAACGKDCLGGACDGGECQPFLFASLSGATQVVASADTVYVTTTLKQPPLWCDVKGCGVAEGVLGTLQSAPYGLALDPASGAVFVARVDGVFRFSARPTDSGQQIATDIAVASAVDSTTAYYADIGHVWGCPLPSCTGGPRLIATASELPIVSIAVDDTYAFWATSDGGAGGVFQASKATVDGGSTSSTGSDGDPQHLFVAGGALYRPIAGGFYDGAIFRDVGGLTGPEHEIIAPHSFNPTAIAVDGNSVWFAAFTTASAGSIRRCELATCGDAGAVSVATVSGTPRSVAVTAKAVFWTDPNVGVIAVAR